MDELKYKNDPEGYWRAALEHFRKTGDVRYVAKYLDWMWAKL